MTLSEIVLPSGCLALLFLLGGVALVFRRTRRRAWLPLAAGGLLYLVFSNGVVATLLLSPLEYRYAAMRDPTRFADARVIVVLTAYGAEDPNVPLSSRLNSSSSFRVVEAANLLAARPDCRIVVSGTEPAASIMARQLEQLGVPRDSLTLDGESRSTAESASFMAAETAGGRMFLVTSAGHMQRAVGVFRKQGLAVIPVPTDYLLPRDPAVASWGPSAVHLRASDLAIHEYLAVAWYWMTGRL